VGKVIYIEEYKTRKRTKPLDPDPTVYWELVMQFLKRRRERLDKERKSKNLSLASKLKPKKKK